MLQPVPLDQSIRGGSYGATSSDTPFARWSGDVVHQDVGLAGDVADCRGELGDEGEMALLETDHRSDRQLRALTNSL